MWQAGRPVCAEYHRGRRRAEETVPFVGGTLLATALSGLSLNDIDVKFGRTGGETNIGGCVSDLSTGRVTADLAIRECPAGDEKEHCETEFATANFNVAPKRRRAVSGPRGTSTSCFIGR